VINSEDLNRRQNNASGDPLPSLLPTCFNIPVCDFQVTMENLISWFKSVWLGLEISTGHWSPIRVEGLWINPYKNLCYPGSRNV